MALVPTLGMPGAPAVLRLAIAVSLALSTVPLGGRTSPSLALLLSEVARCTPVAVVAAVALWVAAQTGSLVDELRGVKGRVSLPGLSEPASPLGALLALLASATFFAGGGAARVAMALQSAPALSVSGVVRSAEQLASGVTIAVAVAAPLLVAAIVVEVFGALLSRLASPAQLGSVVSPLKAVVTLGIVAVLFERLAVALGAVASGVP